MHIYILYICVCVLVNKAIIGINNAFVACLAPSEHFIEPTLAYCHLDS